MFLWPPRPERAIEPALIPYYASKGWIAQLKKNGTCTVISVDVHGNVDFKTRHNEAHKAWAPPIEIVNYFSHFPDSVFVGELLHNKHASVKNTLYLFDLLRYNGVDFIGETLEYRLGILDMVVPLMPNIQMVKNYSGDLTKLYDSISDPIDEGIVLKDPKAKLKSCLREGANSGWQVKCRKSTKNFGF